MKGVDPPRLQPQPHRTVSQFLTFPIFFGSDVAAGAPAELSEELSARFISSLEQLQRKALGKAFAEGSS
jgi:hypothetical protein